MHGERTWVQKWSSVKERDGYSSRNMFGGARATDIRLFHDSTTTVLLNALIQLRSQRKDMDGGGKESREAAAQKSLQEGLNATPTYGTLRTSMGATLAVDASIHIAELPFTCVVFTKEELRPQGILFWLFCHRCVSGF